MKQNYSRISEELGFVNLLVFSLCIENAMLLDKSTQNFSYCTVGIKWCWVFEYFKSDIC